jgi:hypothetical protein
MSLLEVTRTYKENTYGSSQTLLNLEIIKVKMMFNYISILHIRALTIK